MKKLFALILATALILSLAACGTQPEASEPTSTPEPTVAPTPTPEPATTPTPTLDMPEGILGSNYVDITLGLESFGLTDHPHTKAPTEALSVFAASVSANCEDPAIDTAFDYSLTLDSDGRIISGSFGTNSLFALDNSIYTQAAEIYLAYCATFPYTSNDTAAARAWVEENMPSVADLSDGDSAGEVSTSIGGVKFTLYGTKTASGIYGAFWLYIEKADD